jgi:hypothetical protein
METPRLLNLEKRRAKTTVSLTSKAPEAIGSSSKICLVSGGPASPVLIFLLQVFGQSSGLLLSKMLQTLLLHGLLPGGSLSSCGDLALMLHRNMTRLARKDSSDSTSTKS